MLCLPVLSELHKALLDSRKLVPVCGSNRPFQGVHFVPKAFVLPTGTLPTGLDVERPGQLCEPHCPFFDLIANLVDLGDDSGIGHVLGVAAIGHGSQRRLDTQIELVPTFGDLSDKTREESRGEWIS